MSNSARPRPGVKTRQASDPAPKVGYEFHPLSKSLLRSGKLSFGALVLYSVLANLTDHGRRLCTDTDEDLAFEICRAPSCVRRFLVELEEAGLIGRRFGKSQRTREGIEVLSPSQVAESSATRSLKVRRPVAESSVTQVAESSVTPHKEERARVLKNGERTEKEFAGGVSRSSREEQSRPLRFPHPPGQRDEVAELVRDLAHRGWSLGPDGLLRPRADREGNGYPLTAELRRRLAEYRAQIAAVEGQDLSGR